MEIDWKAVRRLMFVCHGNICRSPMMECVMRYLLDQAGVTDVEVASSAVSAEEIGNGIHPGAQAELRRLGIPVPHRRAVQLKPADAGKYDLFLCADAVNLNGMVRILGKEHSGRCFRLLDFTEHPRDIADPWWTGRFAETTRDVLEGCQAILRRILDAAG